MYGEKYCDVCEKVTEHESPSRYADPHCVECGEVNTTNEEEDN